MDPITLALLGTAASAAASGISGLFGRKKQSSQDAKKQELIDDILASVKGNGSYNDLFNTSEDAFNKSYVEPAKHLFNTQIAPQIQQQYIATGQQRGSGMEDMLTRAGVDLDQMLNQQFYGFQQNALNRQQGALNSALGMPELSDNQSYGQAFNQGFSGYLSGGGAQQDISKILRSIPQQNGQRKGFQE